MCSALAAEALRYGGFYRRWPDVYDVDPAELMHSLLDAGGREITVDEARPGDVGFGHSAGLVAAAIRFDQRIHHEPDAQVNHAFLLDRLRAPA